MRLVAGGHDLTRTVTFRAQRVCDALTLGVLEWRRMVFALQPFVRAVVTDGPLDVDAVGWQPRIQLVGHRTVEVAVVLAREGPELREVERRVARLERVHRPSDHLDALIEAVIA